jgi:hypothetical protein
MDENWKHVFTRLDNLEAGLSELREITWPVCQGLVDKRTGPFQNMEQKRRFFKFIDVDEIRKLLRSKAVFMGICQDLVYEELRQVRVERPRLVGE